MRTTLRLITLLLSCVMLAACGSRSDTFEDANRWSVGEESRDMQSIVDMRDRPTDAGSDTPDMDIVPREDMPPSVREDMPGLDQDMFEEADVPPDMPPRVCEDLGELERVAPGGILRGVLSSGDEQSVEFMYCPSLTPSLSRSFVLEVDREMIIDIWTTYEDRETTVQAPVLILEDGCDPLLTEEDFIGCSKGPGDDEEGRQASIRQRIAPGEYVLTVAERTTRFFDADGGSYVIHVDEVEDLESNGTCEDAEPLQPNSAVYNGLTSGIGDRSRTNSCFAGSNMFYYTLDVPPRHGVELSAAYNGPVRDISLRVDTSCDRSPQSFCEQRRWVTGRGDVDWANETDRTQRYIIAMDIDQRLPFRVDNTVIPLAPNAFCEGAEPVALGTSSISQPWIVAGPKEQMCFTTDRRRSLYYSVTVPDQHRLHLYGTAAALRTGCGDVQTECIEQPYINRSGQPEEVILMTSQRSTSGDTSQVTPVAVPLAPHSSCDAPVALDPNGTPLSNQNILAGGESINECQIVFVDGLPTLYYSLAIPLGGPTYRVTATANDPGNNFTLSLQALQRADDPAQCFTGMCRASSDGYFSAGNPASMDISPDFGGGRDPVPVIIAVTMAAPYELEGDSRFSIRAEPLAP